MKLIKNNIFILCITGLLLQASISKDNWYNDPRVVESRKIYNEVNELIKEGKLTMLKRLFEYCEPYVDMDRVIYIDPKSKVIRKYYYTAGSGDSGMKVSAYYSNTGTLRFTYTSQGNYMGEENEYRIYYDENGKAVWQKYNYSFVNKEMGNNEKSVEYSKNPSVNDEKELKDPLKYYISKNKCKEIIHEVEFR